jgi:hypothetical protein
MSTQSVGCAADSTEVCRSLMSVMSDRTDWFDGSRGMGRYFKVSVEPKMHTVHNVLIGFIKI